MNPLITNTAGIRNQKGMTLMGVLVSINLSMLTMLASLSLFLNHHLSVAEMEEGTSYNSQLSHAMIVLEKEISVAGFDMSGAAVNQRIVVNTVAAAGGNAGTLSVYWRYDNAGTFVCNGFREQQSTVNGRQYRTLSLISATTGCASGGLSAATWVSSAIVAQWRITTELAAYLASNNGNILQVQTQSATCSPYGVMPPQLRMSAILSSPSFAQIHDTGSSVQGASLTVCLSNMS